MLSKKNEKPCQYKISDYNPYFIITYMMSPVPIVLIVFIHLFCKYHCLFWFVKNIAVAVLFLYVLLIVVYIFVYPLCCTSYYDYLRTRPLVVFDSLPYENRL